MKIFHRRFALCLLTALPLSFVPTSVLAAPAKTSAKPTSLGANVQSPTITVPDPKRPGKLQLMVHALEMHGDFGLQRTLYITKAYAQLYQLGQPSAILTAPTAVASSRSKTVIVTATGGVVAKSLTHPGTMLTADKMVWYAGQNKIIATGHVVYKDGKTGATLTGPSMVANTQMQSVSMGSGQASANL